jgi:hypothetical protein
MKNFYLKQKKFFLELKKYIKNMKYLIGDIGNTSTKDMYFK